MIASECGLGYEDECFGISLSYRRTYTSDRNVPPATSWRLRAPNSRPTTTPPSQSDLFPQHLYSQIAL